MEKQRRVMLKLSGEALAGEKKTGFDEEVVKDVARQVKLSVDQGVQVAIVIGGGNFWRGRSSNAIDRPKADQIGMLATVMNLSLIHIFAILPQPDWRDDNAIHEFGKPRLGFLVSSGNMDSMVNHYSVSKKRRQMDAYRCV